jgi:hypothetical protein
MGTTLDNGTYLPDEGERNCYDGLAGNWVALDNHLGGTDIHVTINDKQAWNGHIADTTIHVTSADKQAWNGHVADTDIHVTTSDKTTWNTVTSKANDSDVVHITGNESISGQKSFSDRIIINNNIATIQNDVPYLLLKNPLVERASTTLEGYQQIRFVDKNANNIGTISAQTYTSGTSDIILTSYSQDGNTTRTTGVVVRRSPTASKFHPYSDNVTALGETNRRWSRVYANEYYYGSDNTEFSQKFVTTDTAQTVSGSKTFSSNVNVYNSDNTADTPNIILKNSKAERGSTTNIGEQNIFFLDKDNAQIANIKCITNSSGVSNMYFTCNVSGSDKGVRLSRTPSTTYFRSSGDNDCKLGTSDVRWSDVQTYKVNALEPSALGMPDLANGIDISSYFDISLYTGQTYTPPANGWISLSITSPNRASILCEATGISQTAYSVTDPDDNNRYRVSILIPCQESQTLTIYLRASSGTVNFAKFYPCQGNV